MDIYRCKSRRSANKVQLANGGEILQVWNSLRKKTAQYMFQYLLQYLSPT